MNAFVIAISTYSVNHYAYYTVTTIYQRIMYSVYLHRYMQRRPMRAVRTTQKKPNRILSKMGVSEIKHKKNNKISSLIDIV